MFPKIRIRTVDSKHDNQYCQSTQICLTKFAHSALLSALDFFQYRALAEAEANDSGAESFTDAVEWTRYMVRKYLSLLADGVRMKRRKSSKV